jgi:hypothetical protein
MRFTWGNRRALPRDAVTTQSSITKIIGDRRYIEYCDAATKVQEYWRSPEYIVESEGVPILTSNINAGDFFNHGKGSTQIGIVSAKITLMGKPDLINLRESTHPTSTQYLNYKCAGEMGGFIGNLWHDYGFGNITSGYFIWLPLPMQLKLAGFNHDAEKLNCLMANIIAEVRS